MWQLFWKHHMNMCSNIYCAVFICMCVCFGVESNISQQRYHLLTLTIFLVGGQYNISQPRYHLQTMTVGVQHMSAKIATPETDWGVHLRENCLKNLNWFLFTLGSQSSFISIYRNERWMNIFPCISLETPYMCVETLRTGLVFLRQSIWEVTCLGLL